MVISHKGTNAASNDSLANWLHNFAAGLLTTCGLTYAGPPENDRYGVRGLHDRITYMPAEIESVVQPDMFDLSVQMSVTGRMLQSTVFGSSLELNRRISTQLGTAKIKLHDTVSNLGNLPAPHMLFYHINLGWPLIDDGTRIIWEGKAWKRPNQSLNIEEQQMFKICKPPIEEHNGGGEVTLFIDVDADDKGLCYCTAFNSKINLGMKVTFRKDQLPRLTNWQHWGKHEYVTGLEPCTYPPVGQSVARNDGKLIFLQPREMREYDLELEIIFNT